MSKAKRKRYTGAFKAKVGLEALVGIKTVGQIAREYQVHPVQVTQWKGVIRDHLPDLFESPQKAQQDHEQVIAQLHEKIGPIECGGGLAEKKVQAAGPVRVRRELIEPWPELSLQRQCELVGTAVDVLIRDSREPS
jgi:transposase-like protein